MLEDEIADDSAAVVSELAFDGGELLLGGGGFSFELCLGLVELFEFSEELLEFVIVLRHEKSLAAKVCKRGEIEMLWEV